MLITYLINHLLLLYGAKLINLNDIIEYHSFDIHVYTVKSFRYVDMYDALVKYFNPIRNTYFTNKTASDKTINQIPVTDSAICIETVNVEQKIDFHI